ncbi:MAG: glycosyl transferase, partial [Phycisphaerae bacterium]
MAGRRMTVLQVLPALQSGGTERGVLEIGEALVREGHRSLV